MTPEQIKKLQEENERYKAENAELKQKADKTDEYATENAKLKETIQEKDSIIEQKTKDVVGARRKYKLLSEMSEEERSQLSEEEIAKKEEQDELYQRTTEIEKQTQERAAAEREERINKAIANRVGDNAQLADKIKQNFSSLKDADEAFTESQIDALMGTAFNMLGDERPDPVQQAHQGYNPSAGTDPNAGQGDNFADSEAGKSLGQSMGLTFAQPGNEQ